MRRSRSRGRPLASRLLTTLALIVAGLAVAWYLIEKRHIVQATVFQPFRMATMGRGIALLLMAGRVVNLWRVGRWLPRMRAILLAVSVIGDWLMVVVTLAELAASAAEAVRSRLTPVSAWQAVDAVVFIVMLGLGLNFLGHHDTEYGHLPASGCDWRRCRLRVAGNSAIAGTHDQSDAGHGLELAGERAWRWPGPCRSLR